MSDSHRIVQSLIFVWLFLLQNLQHLNLFFPVFCAILCSHIHWYFAQIKVFHISILMCWYHTLRFFNIIFIHCDNFMWNYPFIKLLVYLNKVVDMSIVIFAFPIIDNRIYYNSQLEFVIPHNCGQICVLLDSTIFYLSIQT